MTPTDNAKDRDRRVTDKPDFLDEQYVVERVHVHSRQGAHPARRLRGPDPSSRSTPACAPRARTAPRAARVLPRSTTSGGPSSGSPRPCCARRRSPATPSSASASSAHRPLRWPEGGLDAGQVREIRTLKARMEAERLPRGADRKTHFKLGHGGLSDVEWCVQLVQLQHAHDHEAADHLDDGGAGGGRAARARRRRATPPPCRAWRLASPMRNAGVLVPRPSRRRRALRPARRRRHRPDPGPARWLRPGAGRPLPAGRAPCPRTRPSTSSTGLTLPRLGRRSSSPVSTCAGGASACASSRARCPRAEFDVEAALDAVRPIVRGRAPTAVPRRSRRSASASTASGPPPCACPPRSSPQRSGPLDPTCAPPSRSPSAGPASSTRDQRRTDTTTRSPPAARSPSAGSPSTGSASTCPAASPSTPAASS